MVGCVGPLTSSMMAGRRHVFHGRLSKDEQETVNAESLCTNTKINHGDNQEFV